MGIRDLKPFLRKKAPSSITSMALKDLKGKRIGVDLFTYLYQNLRGGGERVMYNGLVNMINHMNTIVDPAQENYVIYVLDGPKKPTLKSKEHAKRKQAKQNTLERRANLIKYRAKLLAVAESLDSLTSEDPSCLLLGMGSDAPSPADILGCSTISEISIQATLDGLTLDGASEENGELSILRVKRDKYLSIIQENVPRNSRASITAEGLNNTISIVDGIIEKYYIQTLDIKDEVLKTITNILSAMGSRYVIAPGEGEEYCCHLFRADLIDVIVSKDTDVIAYSGVPHTYDLRLATKSLEVLNKEAMIAGLGLTGEKMLLEFLILCGCDYNDRLVQVGPARAHTQLLKHGSISGMQANSETERLLRGKDFEGLKQSECTAIFCSPYGDELLIPPLTTPNPIYIEELHLSEL